MRGWRGWRCGCGYECVECGLVDRDEIVNSWISEVCSVKIVWVQEGGWRGAWSFADVA